MTRSTRPTSGRPRCRPGPSPTSRPTTARSPRSTSTRTPRDGKYNHAAVWNYRNGASSVPRQAQSALVVNFDKRGLTLRELETLMHEFGHTLRNNLSATRYASDAGENVAQDFAEAPSQMLEDWVYDKKVLKVFQEVCTTCKPVPDDLVDKARAARDFGKGPQVARQQLYAAYDLVAARRRPRPIRWTRGRRWKPPRRWATCPARRSPSGFAHIASGYGAGYYGYLWSQAVATDMRTAFGVRQARPEGRRAFPGDACWARARKSRRSRSSRISWVATATRRRSSTGSRSSRHRMKKGSPKRPFRWQARRDAHSASEAKSASRERSPRASVMCPPWGQPLKRSTA